MLAGFLIGVISIEIWIHKCTGAPTVTLTASSSPYFDIEGSISMTCSINENVNIVLANLIKGETPYVGIYPGNSGCEFISLVIDDPHTYSGSCEQHMKTVHITINRANASDHNIIWKCGMTCQSCGCPGGTCVSTSGVTTVLRVLVSSVQLTDGTGQQLVTPVPVLDGSNKDFRCDTSPNGSRPQALFKWYKRSENQSPILIQDQSISTPGPNPKFDLSISTSNSTLTMMGSRSYHNMYIYCEAQDETNRGNITRSREVQLNIVYPPVVQLFPPSSSWNVTESDKFEFRCNVTDANPMPQPDGYSWLFAGRVLQGQTRSSLGLLNVHKSQDGVYQCMAKNEYGIGNSSTVHLNVHYGPAISLINYTTIEGANVSIACNVTANPQPDIVWIRNGTIISSDTLKIPNISRLQDGDYTCRASNVLYPTGQTPVLKSATGVLRISVSYGPGNSIYLTPNILVSMVEEGSIAPDIVCRATCNPECSYKWFKGEVQINDSSTLSLGTVLKNMTGNYTCEAFNSIGGQRSGANKTVEVIVRYAPVVKLQAAVRDINPYKVKQGRENVVLVCDVVDAYPPPTSFIWTHNGTEKSQGGSNFTIPVATRQTSGTWGCKGINGYGTPLESQLPVDVQYGPIVKLIGNKIVKENQLFSVTCNIDSNPLPLSVLWTKDNNSTFFHNTSVLKIDIVKRYDSGTYRCTAVNTIQPSGLSEESLNGTEWFYLDVQYGAEIINLSVTEGNTVNENTTATLRCLVDSNPKSNITWTKQGILGNLQTNYSVHESQLIIEHAQCLGTFNYTCSANNGLDLCVERNVPLYVICHPRTDNRLPLVKQVYSKRYGNASLNYTVIAFPAPIFNWSFIGNGSESKHLPDSTNKHDIGLQSILIFTNLSINDFGFYRVVANNSLPTSATEDFQLIPADVPDMPSNVTVTEIKQTSLTVNWVAGFNGGLQQTFHIIIATANDITSVYAPDPGYGQSGTKTIEKIMANTEYSISMSAHNSMGSSSVTKAIQVITLPVPGTVLPISAIAGGVAGGMAAVVLLVIIIFIWRRNQNKKSREEDDSSNDFRMRTRPESGLVDNPVYDTSGPVPGPSATAGITEAEYAKVNKPKKKTSNMDEPSNIYAQVNKTKKNFKKDTDKRKHGKPSRGDIYENAADLVVNTKAEPCDESLYEDAGVTGSNGPMKNKDGLHYADLVLGPPSKKDGKDVIRGIENRTEYAEIAYGKRGEPLPDSDN